MLENPPANAGDMGSIPGPGIGVFRPFLGDFEFPVDFCPFKMPLPLPLAFKGLSLCFPDFLPGGPFLGMCGLACSLLGDIIFITSSRCSSGDLEFFEFFTLTFPTHPSHPKRCAASKRYFPSRTT